jgi:hypothetical protein
MGCIPDRIASRVRPERRLEPDCDARKRQLLERNALSQASLDPRQLGVIQPDGVRRRAQAQAAIPARNPDLSSGRDPQRVGKSQRAVAAAFGCGHGRKSGRDRQPATYPRPAGPGACRA